jgi:ABC-2 type transport system ATP-binding protein
MDTVLQVRNLKKKYRDVEAVKDVSFEVYQGEIFGMVGPNGAGKTTTIECLEGLRVPDAGQISVLGLDPLRERTTLVEFIGVQLQTSNLPGRLHVEEALALFASLYPDTVPLDDLLERMGLQEKRHSPIAQLSGGQKQRLFIALALINRPRLVFLDELTTGLDPQARRSMWDMVREMRRGGCTIFLTTHFMEEAERLCDRVAIMDEGELIALDSPQALVHSLEREKRIVFHLSTEPAELQLAAIPGVTNIEVNGDRVSVDGYGERFISSVVTSLEDHRADFFDLRTEQPTLEDVFLRLTGRRMRE